MLRPEVPTIIDRLREINALLDAFSHPPTECSECGALVADAETHAAWHEAEAGRVRIALLRIKRMLGSGVLGLS